MMAVNDDAYAWAINHPSPSFPRRGVARWRLSQIICSIIELAKLECYNCSLKFEEELEMRSTFKILF